MSPAEDALLWLRLAERHFGSLKGTLDAETFADQDWGFLVQQMLEKLLQALLQAMALCGDSPLLAPELLELDDFAVLARYDAEPTRLPAG